MVSPPFLLGIALTGKPEERRILFCLREQYQEGGGKPYMPAFLSETRSFTGAVKPSPLRGEQTAPSGARVAACNRNAHSGLTGDN